MLKLIPVRQSVANLRTIPLTADLLVQAAEMSDGQMSSLLAAETFARILTPGLSFAVLDGEQLVSVWGIVPIWHGLAQGWQVFTPLARPRHKAGTTRIVRARFDQWNVMPAYRRIEIHVRADQPWRASFAHRLGMTEEPALMRCWDAQGRDYFLYARVA